MEDTVQSEEMKGRCLPVFVHKCYEDPWVTARVVPRKGPEQQAAIMTAEDVGQRAMCKFVYKSDGEPAIRALKQSAIRKLLDMKGPVDVIFEKCGLAEYQQSVVVERKI